MQINIVTADQRNNSLTFLSFFFLMKIMKISGREPNTLYSLYMTSMHSSLLKSGKMKNDASRSSCGFIQ